MKGADILRLVDAIHREKNIDKEVVFEGLENALFSAARKKLGNSNEIFIEIDRKSGDITAFDGESAIDPATLGRIAALTAKQVMIQKFREAERDNTYDEYIRKVGQLITGTIQRVERPNVIVNLGRADGIIPWREQAPTENYNVGERVKCLVLEVKKVRQQVRIILSRSSSDLLRHLFDLEVPEVADGVIEIKVLARDAGHRAKVAVRSLDHNVDCVGACVGIRGSRIKNIVDELNGEKIDIVRWNESDEVFIRNSMRPAEINAIQLDYDTRHAKVFVNEDQLSLAIGRRGQNVRLASSLTGWNLDLLTGTPDAYEERFQATSPKPEAGEAAAPAESKLDSILPQAPAAEGEEAEGAAPARTGAAALDAIMSAPPTGESTDEADNKTDNETAEASAESTDSTDAPADSVSPEAAEAASTTENPSSDASEEAAESDTKSESTEAEESAQVGVDNPSEGA